jgi:anti-sigma B factor antagonist
MRLTEASVGDVTVLRLAGRLVLDDGDARLRDVVNEVVALGRTRIVIDLGDVTYIDSCGLGVLIAKLVSVRNKGGDLKLARVSARSHRLLEICKLEGIFQVFESEADAVASFGAPQSPR